MIALAGDWAVLVGEAGLPRETVLGAIDSDRLLAVLASFVTNGAYIVIEVEFGRRWRVSLQAGCLDAEKLGSSLSDLWWHLPYRWRRGFCPG